MKPKPIAPRAQALTGYVMKAEGGAQDDGILQVCIAGDGQVDRDGDIIDPAGMDAENFLRNPVLLFCHDYFDAPIGKILKIWQDQGKTYFTPQFAIDISEKAAQVYQLYLGGYLNTFSIGFIPKAWEMITMDDGTRVRKCTSYELLEISAVPVPSNPGALVAAKTKGLKVEHDGKALIEEDEAAAKAEAEKKAAEDNAVAKKATDMVKDVVNGVLEPLTKQMTEVTAQVENLSKQLQVMAGDKAPSGQPKPKVGGEDAGVVEFTKRVLQTADKAIGLALKDLKKVDTK